ncbi:MAG: M14 family zinc carboxypeptidase [Chitinophagaceae bacterium]|nr:M14 family zinc carboxypeptidase [Chitinophagaceae bacterium]
MQIRKFGLIFLAGVLGLVTQAQIKTPEEFLGYKIGTRFTPYWKMVSYFQHVAQYASDVMKLEQYGETYEGRPLLLAYISSAEHIKNLESVRLNNLRMAQLIKDGKPTDESAAPAIVWLSYNVHGNEPASSETAMLALYAFVRPDEKIRSWLKNTVIIIDPCLNPDGRDRYVNWFHTAVGKKFDPDPLSREHREHWPQGRTNHYQFDLNRDWAWQTQKESQYRIKKYLQWMPQVHVDFHEQGFNEPYYFAPAAQPYHEVITGWQKEFQEIIGKNNARYFDAHHWLYFTKQRFDLFYPSYGDTYPTFNGAIGMTYEQGGISGGLGVITEEGDTLTLEERVQHHFITTLSTVEISSQHASQLIREFKKYFQQAVQNGIGEFKSYVIQHSEQNEERIGRLLELLDKNGIEYGYGNGTFRGINYFTGNEENFTLSARDIVISALQPRSAMVKVLFEPKSKLNDSVTYDITAWSLPYVYGVKAYASGERIPISGKPSAKKINNPNTEYGYVLPWKGMASARTVSELLKKGILLRVSEVPFEAGGKKFERGAILILQSSNKAFGKGLWEIVRKTADENNVALYPVKSGWAEKGPDFGSDLIHPLKPPRVGLITGDAVSATASGSIWHFFDEELNYPVTQILANDIQRINWNKFDVLIMPEGNYRFLNDKELTEGFKQWIRRGGRVIAFGSAMTQLAKNDIGFKVKNEKEEDKKSNESKQDYSLLKKFENREREELTEMTTGSIYRISLDNTHPLAFGYPDYYYTLRQDGGLYEFIKEGGWNVGVLKKENPVSGFVGFRLKETMKDGLIFGVVNMGSGSVIGFADDIMFRSFWENGKLMLCNAVFFSAIR